MKILSINTGISSVKYQLLNIDGDNHTLLLKGNLKRSTLFHDTLEKLLDEIVDSSVITSLEEIEAFGHRVVHGGSKYTSSVLVDDEVVSHIRSLIPLAPLHNPASIDAIETIKSKFPKAKQVAVFDTAFHQSMPQVAYMYAIPYKLYENDQIRRYGFHGVSHQHVASEAAKLLNKPLNQTNLITIHLGNGGSVAAIKNGKSIDTTMGFTPLEGIMMGARSGDIDPGIIFNLYGQHALEMKEIYNLLQKKSGLKGIAGKSDLREVLKDAYDGDEKSILALEMFSYRVKKYIGAYKEVLDNVDAIVFTGGIGENSDIIRKMIYKNIDPVLNRNSINADGYLDITNYNSEKTSNTKVFVIAANEELEIAKQVAKLLG